MIDPITSSILLNIIKNRAVVGSDMKKNLNKLNNQNQQVGSNLSAETIKESGASDTISNVKILDEIVELLGEKIGVDNSKVLKNLLSENKNFNLLFKVFQVSKELDLPVNDVVEKLSNQIKAFVDKEFNKDIDYDSIIKKVLGDFNKKNILQENISVNKQEDSIGRVFFNTKELSSLLPKKSELISLITKLFSLKSIKSISTLGDLTNFGLLITGKNESGGVQKNIFINFLEKSIIKNMCMDVLPGLTDSKQVKTLKQVIDLLDFEPINNNKNSKIIENLPMDSNSIISVNEKILVKLIQNIDKPIGNFFNNVSLMDLVYSQNSSDGQNLNILELAVDKCFLQLIDGIKTNLLGQKKELFTDLNIFKLFFDNVSGMFEKDGGSNSLKKYGAEDLSDSLKNDIFKLIKNVQNDKSDNSIINRSMIENLIKLNQQLFSEITIPFYDNSYNNYFVLKKNRGKKRELLSITIKANAKNLGEIDIHILKNRQKIAINFNSNKESKKKIKDELPILLERLDGFSIESII